VSSQSRERSSGQRAKRAGRPAPNAEGSILQATEELLATIPLHDLSVAQIIEHAGVSRATFYFYFSSKFGVVASLVKQAIDEIYAVSRPTLHSPPGPSRVAALRQRIRDSATVWDTHRPVLRATVDNWHVYPELRDLWLEMLAGLTDAIASELEDERADGSAPDGPDARAVGAVLAWSTERCLYTIGIEEFVAGPEERDARLDALTEMWLSMMYGQAANGRRAAA
jgi:TetR/AcrR family transcriptional regulator, ethionamide resistance regulator